MKQSRQCRVCASQSPPSHIDVSEGGIGWNVDASLAVRAFFKRNKRRQLRHNSRKPPVSNIADTLAHRRARDTIFEVTRGCQGVSAAVYRTCLRPIGARHSSRSDRVIAPRVAKYSIPATWPAHTRHFRCVIGYQTAAADGGKSESVRRNAIP